MEYRLLGELANHYGWQMHLDMHRTWNARKISEYSAWLVPLIEVVDGTTVIDRYHDGDFHAYKANDWSDV